jgi:hypothetical protein
MNARLFQFLGLLSALLCCVSCGPPEGLSVAVGAREPASLGAKPEQEDDLDASNDRPAPPRSAPVYSHDIAPLLEQYCLGCHDRISAQGGVVLDVFRDGAPDLRQKSLMLRIADNLRSESMPPDGEPRPTVSELETLNSWLDTASEADPRTAQVAIRRLNRVNTTTPCAT